MIDVLPEFDAASLYAMCEVGNKNTSEQRLLHACDQGARYDVLSVIVFTPHSNLKKDTPCSVNCCAGVASCQCWSSRRRVWEARR